MAGVPNGFPGQRLGSQVDGPDFHLKINRGEAPLVAQTRSDDADLRRPSRVRMGLNLRHEAPDHPLDRFHQAGFGNAEGRHAFPYLNQKTQRLYT